MHALIPSRWQVPEIFSERLGEKVGRQRLMEADGHLLLVLHRAPKSCEDDRHARLFWRHPNGDWQASEGGSGLGELREQVAEYDRESDRLELLLRGTPTPEHYYQVLHEGTPLFRAARHMATVLQQAREAAPEDRQLLLLRDDAVDIERNLELMHAEAMHGLQYLVAQRSEEQTKQGEQLVASSHRLNLIMALCLPMTALASVLGMNLRHGLENQDTWVFWVVLGIGVLLGFLVVAMVAAPVKAKPAPLPPGKKRK
jgi:hypothetical protein